MISIGSPLAYSCMTLAYTISDSRLTTPETAGGFFAKVITSSGPKTEHCETLRLTGKVMTVCKLEKEKDWERTDK